jgi:DNA polymerase III gamma/tau subunit
MIDALRDLMVLKTAGADTTMVALTSQQRQVAQGIATQFDLPGLVYAITALDRVRWPIKNSETPRPLLEATVVRLAASEHFLDAGVITNRLSAVERQSDPSNSRDQAKETPRPFDPAGPQDLEARWPEVLKLIEERLGKATAGLLGNASIKFDGQALTLSFSPTGKLQYQMVQSKLGQGQLQQLLGQYMGRDVQIYVELQTNAQGPEPAQVRPAGQRILDDPLVKAVLLGLEATITGIEDK